MVSSVKNNRWSLPSFTFLHPRYSLKPEHLSRSTPSLWGLGPQALTEARPVSALSSPSRNLASDPGAGQTAAPARVRASPRLTASRTGHGLAPPGVKRPREPGRRQPGPATVASPSALPPSASGSCGRLCPDLSLRQENAPFLTPLLRPHPPPPRTAETAPPLACRSPCCCLLGHSPRPRWAPRFQTRDAVTPPAAPAPGCAPLTGSEHAGRTHSLHPSGAPCQGAATQ